MIGAEESGRVAPGSEVCQSAKANCAKRRYSGSSLPSSLKQLLWYCFDSYSCNW